MSRNLYALLVGINEYPEPKFRLSGCVNDIIEVEKYLTERVEHGFNPRIRKLLNQEATRQAIIDGFRQHLCQAGSNDIVLFYYSGHGSQGKTPKEFWHLEPDRLDEMLVCYDSRSEGSWGLADKELAYLIAEVSEKNPHICIILDCCHSSSGTKREWQVRRLPEDERERPLDTYIFSPHQLKTLSFPRSKPEDNPSGWNLPQGRHILLSACRDYQLAYETNKQRGVFSYCLMETLHHNGKLTYRDLFKQANALVRSQFENQSPQLEVRYSDDENRFFLNSAIAERQPYFTASYTKDYGWVIDGGVVHGVQRPSNSETTLLALFPIDCQNLRDPSKSVGVAEVTEVLPSLSKVEISGIDNLTKDCTFKAVVTSVPLSPLGVYFEGEKAGVDLARQALHSASFGNQPSAYVHEEKELAKAEVRLLCRDEQYLVVRPTDDHPLVEQIDDYTIENAEKAIQRLEHIARWNTIVKLESRPDSSIQSGDVKMMFFSEENEELPQSQPIRLEYQYKDGKWEKPELKLKLINTSKKTLFCAVVDLGDLFEVYNSLIDVGCVRLEAEQSTWVPANNTLCPEVPNDLWEQGITEYKDIFKLIVSTTEFDARLMTQNELDAPRPLKRNVPSDNESTLDRLMDRVQNRAAKPRSKGKINDWYTEKIVVTTVRPLENISVSSTEPKELLRTGAQLQPHPSLQAKVRLTTAPQISRDVGNKIVPPIFQDDPSLTQPFNFVVSYGTAPELSILELNDVEDYTVVTPDSPLKLIIDTPLQDNEYVLPIGYDGEFFLPLGLGRTTQDGKTEIELERLPEPVSQGKRDLKGTIRIYFQKVLREQLGLEFQW